MGPDKATHTVLLFSAPRTLPETKIQPQASGRPTWMKSISLDCVICGPKVKHI